jgi:hypothetical protein
MSNNVLITEQILFESSEPSAILVYNFLHILVF